MNPKSPKRFLRWRYLGLALLLTPLLAITSLELLSRFYRCSPAAGSEARTLTACDAELYTQDTENQKLLVALKDKQLQGIAPTEAELRQAVFAVERKSIGGNNGIVCNGAAFVSNDLPPAANLFVRRHELEHIFQQLLSRQEKNPEFAANVAAAKEYPVGLLSTTLFSIWESRTVYPSPLCWLIGLWATFKIYFLP